MSFWTPAEVDKLIDAWQHKRLPASEISLRVLRLRTRNAVLGKLRRLGLRRRLPNS